MRFLPVSTMAFLTLLATILCLGRLDNQNLANGEHSEPCSCGCREGRGWPHRRIACPMCVKIALVVFAFYLPAWNQLQGKAGP